MDNECRDAFYSEEYFGILVEYEGSGELVKEEYNSNCFYPISYRFAVIFLTQGEGEKVPYETMPFSVIPIVCCNSQENNSFSIPVDK